MIEILKCLFICIFFFIELYTFKSSACLAAHIYIVYLLP
jgi:hypothetical protein